MTDFSHLLSAALMRPLGWTLLHFLWQGLALAAAGSAVMAVSRSSAVRYLVGLATLAIMFAAPVGTFLLFWDSSGEAREAQTVVRPGMAVSQSRASVAAPIAPLNHGRAVPDQAIPASALLWLVQLWFLGVAFLSLRTAGGFLLIERLRRQQAVPMNVRLRERCLALQRRIGLDRVVRYCECQWLEVPAVIGWLRPVVLVPVTALTGLSEEQLEAVIVHELAHVKRWDSAVNLFQIVVETLLFYHPAVWWMNRRIRAERENCCDDIAIACCGDRLEYARALTLMAEWRATPSLALAVNSSPLATRVARLLGLGKFERRIRSAGIAASVLCLSAALIAGNAFLGVAYASLDVAPKLAAPVPNRNDVQNGIQEKEIQPGQAGSEVLYAASVRHATPEAPQTAESEPNMETSQDESKAEQNSADQSKKESYIEGLKSVGLENLSVDQILAMRIQGVTPEYVRGIQQQGLHPDVDHLVGMKIQGVSPEYIRDMRAAIGVNLTGDQLIGMKIQGVTPEYVKELQRLDLHLDVDQLIGMRIQGVTPEYVRDMRAVTSVNLTGNQLIGMKIQGVTPEYVKELQGLQLHPDTNELMGMKIQGVTPEYVRDMRSTGLNPTVQQLVGMRIQGVTSAYVKALQSSGLKLKTEEYVAAKIMGITPEFIEKARSHGFRDLDLHKLISLKQSGVL